MRVSCFVNSNGSVVFTLTHRLNTCEFCSQFSRGQLWILLTDIGANLTGNTLSMTPLNLCGFCECICLLFWTVYIKESSRV